MAMRTAILVVIGLLAAPLALPTVLSAQAQSVTYKLGMFREGERAFIGVVLRDTVVLDLSRADADWPATLRALIEQWDASTAERISSLAASALRDPPADAFTLEQVTTLPPLDDPDAILMAARNYPEHAQEMAAVGDTLGTTSVIDDSVRVGIPSVWVREPGDNRQNPYLFPKLKASLSADGAPIVLPPGRRMIDFECELMVVIGRTARRVPVDEALGYVFGYMAVAEVSDRQERADGRYGSDWFLEKSRDTFGPIGPYVVPAAFVDDPQDLDVRYTLNGEVMIDGNTSLMTHTVQDLVSYASHVVTLRPGDLIGTGTPGGVGQARIPPVYLEAGDVGACTIEGVGTLTNPVVAASVGAGR